MSIFLSPPWLQWPQTQALIAAFSQANVPLRFVGGCVRDALLHREVKDIDAATPAAPDRVMALLAAASIKAIPTSLAHGTVTAAIGLRQFEITTLRKDVACDGRHAKVEFTDDWQEDARRRDFTLNALYLSPAGEIFDYFGGEQDAKTGRIVFIGNAGERIKEDALRILRFFRFYAYYGAAPMDEAGLAACTRHAAMMETLSGERIQSEMMKILASGKAVEALNRMQAVEMLSLLFGTACDTGILARLVALETQLGAAANATLRLAALILTTAAPAEAVSHLRERWKLSNATHKALVLYIRHGSDLAVSADMARQKQAIRRFGNENYLALVLLRAAVEPGPDRAVLATCAAMAGNWKAPEFPLTGGDLLAAGFAEGSALGTLLTALEEYWEAEDYLPSKEALLQKAPSLYRRNT